MFSREPVVDRTGDKPAPVSSLIHVQCKTWSSQDGEKQAPVYSLIYLQVRRLEEDLEKLARERNQLQDLLYSAQEENSKLNQVILNSFFALFLFRIFSNELQLFHPNLSWYTVQHVLYMHLVVPSSLATQCRVDPARYMQQILPIVGFHCSKFLFSQNAVYLHP